MTVENVTLGHSDAAVLSVRLFSVRVHFPSLRQNDAHVVGLGDRGGHRPFLHLWNTISSTCILDMPLVLKHSSIISSIVTLSIGIIFKIPIIHKPLTIRHGSLISTWIA